MFVGRLDGNQLNIRLWALGWSRSQSPERASPAQASAQPRKSQNSENGSDFSGILFPRGGR